MATIPDKRFAHIVDDPRFRRRKTYQRHCHEEKNVLEKFKNKSQAAQTAIAVAIAEKDDRFNVLHDPLSKNVMIQKKKKVKKHKKTQKDENKTIPEEDRFEGKGEQSESEKNMFPGRDDAFISSRKIAPPSSDDENDSSDSSDSNDREHAMQRDPIYFGFSHSDDDDEDDEEEVENQHDANVQNESHEKIALGDPTQRLAVVNLEWDKIAAVDLLVLFKSFCPRAKLNIQIYRSAYGKEKLEEEKKYGPIINRTAEQLEQKLKKREKALGLDCNVDAQNDDDDDDNDDNDDDGGSAAIVSQDKSANTSKMLQGDNEIDDDSADVELDDEEIFNKMLDDQVEDEQKIDREALLAYEKDRLRYYYAIVTCDTVDNAIQLYNEVDGTEFESSANVIDMRFVPDNVTFDDEPTDTADAIPQNYKAPSYITKALQHTNVESNWDTDSKRDKAFRENWTKALENDDNDLSVFLASDNEGYGSDAVVEETDSEASDAEGNGKRKVVLKKRARAKYTTLLDEIKSDLKTVKNDLHPEEELEIVFEPGLKAFGEQIAKKVANKEETTVWSKVLEKRKLKKKEKKAKLKALKNGAKVAENGETQTFSDDAISVDEDDPFFADARREMLAEAASEVEVDGIANDDASLHEPVDDDPIARAKKKRSRAIVDDKKKNKNHMKQPLTADDAGNENEKHSRDELELLMMDFDENNDGYDQKQGYSLQELVKAQKHKSKLDRKGKKHSASNKLRTNDVSDSVATSKDEFTVDTRDERFQSLFVDPKFHIDQTDPNFKATAGMEHIVHERLRRRDQQLQRDAEHASMQKQVAAGTFSSANGSEKPASHSSRLELSQLVDSVKRKADARFTQISGKKLKR